MMTPSTDSTALPSREVPSAAPETVAAPKAPQPKGAFRRSWERHGFWKTVADSSIRFGNRFVFFRILKGVTIERPDPKFLECDAKYRGEFLADDLLRDLVANPENELDHPFLDRVLPQGDECYGFFHGAELAGYGWYTDKPCPTDAEGISVHFDPKYIYMYKGHTHRKHRGQRLHAIGMTRALDAYVKRGYKGLVSYVEWDNTDSLKSCYRMGYKDFGNLYIVKLFGRYFYWAGRGCKQYGFCLKKSLS